MMGYEDVKFEAHEVLDVKCEVDDCENFAKYYYYRTKKKLCNDCLEIVLEEEYDELDSMVNWAGMKKG